MNTNQKKKTQFSLNITSKSKERGERREKKEDKWLVKTSLVVMIFTSF